MDRLPKGFLIAETPLDLGVLRRLMDGVREQLPVPSTAPLRLHRGGIPTMPPDGQHIVGPVPGAAGFFVASGCNVAGLSIAPAIGEELARWIVDGRPSEDLGAMSIARFGPEWRDEQRLRRAAAWESWHFYSYDPPSA
jgi:glycine/D-amino acid oxidase-like deaminating enzyme